MRVLIARRSECEGQARTGVPSAPARVAHGWL